MELSHDAERIVRAFARSPAKPNEEKLLKALLAIQPATAADLHKHCGYERGWPMRFGIMCRRILESDFTPLPLFDDDPGSKFWSGILTNFNEVSREYHFKSTAMEALKSLGFQR